MTFNKVKWTRILLYRITNGIGEKFTGYCDLGQKECNQFKLEYSVSDQVNESLKFLKELNSIKIFFIGRMKLILDFKRIQSDYHLQ